MQNSKIIEVGGIFIGAALCLREGEPWSFIAADTRASAAGGVTGATVEDVELLARRAFFSARGLDS